MWMGRKRGKIKQKLAYGHVSIGYKKNMFASMLHHKITCLPASVILQKECVCLHLCRWTIYYFLITVSYTTFAVISKQIIITSCVTFVIYNDTVVAVLQVCWFLYRRQSCDEIQSICHCPVLAECISCCLASECYERENY